MNTANRSAALPPRQHRKATRRRNGRTVRRVSAPKRLERHTPPHPRCARREPSEWWPAFRASLRPGLEGDTQLMPWLIADTVCSEVSRFLGVEIPAPYSDWLDASPTFATGERFCLFSRGRCVIF